MTDEKAAKECRPKHVRRLIRRCNRDQLDNSLLGDLAQWMALTEEQAVGGEVVVFGIKSIAARA